MRLLLWAAFGWVLSGCLYLRAPVPMTYRPDPYPNGKAKCLVVFLPGAGDDGRAFFEEGFVQAVRAKGLSADIVAADATIRYYLKGTAAERLDLDVMRPNLAKGYERVWMIGMSMGGFGSLFYPWQRPGQVDGVLALAPYLGDDSLVNEIHDAGGLAKWTPPPEAPANADNYQRQMWRWLKETRVEGKPSPSLWLGWGTKDRLGHADELLAAVMPKERILSAEGGHEWEPWRKMLKEFLDKAEIAEQCAP